MQLRHKFSLVALVYLLSLVANLILTCWCILVYFNSAFGGFEEALARQSLIEEVRGGVRQQVRILSEDPGASERRQVYEASQRQITDGLVRLVAEADLPAHVREAIDAAVREKEAIAAAYLHANATIVLSPSDRSVFQQLDRLLGETSRLFSDWRQEQLRQTKVVERRVIMLLSASSLIGASLCVVGLVAMRRWVIKPVSDLRAATRAISQGRFDHRVEPRTDDELGRLAAEVNQMCSTIVEMQRRLVDRERLAVAGETVTRVAHNIRNPLSGIRALAEATRQRTGDDPETADYQGRIIETIDRFERWLRDLQQSVAPLALNPSEVDTGEIVSGVAAVVNGMLMRRNVHLQVELSPQVQRVRVDPLHFEQALVALVTNAVQASPPGEQVLLAVQPVASDSPDWQLTVADKGPGIAPELVDKVFSPYFTTKPDGTGMGLAIAQKVIRLHGGELTVESRPGGGSRFIAVLPGRMAEESHGGHSDHR